VSAGKKRLASELSSLSDAERPLEKARRRADLSGKDPSEDEQKGENDIQKKDIEWLRAQASACPGYEEFCANRGRKLTNRERVKFWAFAAMFSDEYSREFSGAQVRTHSHHMRLIFIEFPSSGTDRQTGE
jgi:hypothetical protein